MLDPQPSPWPRPYFTPGDLPTKLFFVCFAQAPLAPLELKLARLGLPNAELLSRVDVREHRRSAERDWFEGWWQGSFGVIAERDLAGELEALTRSDLCVSLRLELPDQADLAPLQTIWGLTRWLCERGASVVLDVHAFRFRTRAGVEQLGLDASDAERDVKIVFETNATRDGLHLLHTRGLCKVARPELLCFIRPDDADAMGDILGRMARRMMEGALASQLRERVTDGVELVSVPSSDRALIESLGLQSAAVVERSDAVPLAGIGGLLHEA